MVDEADTPGVKHKLCYVAADFDVEMFRPQEQLYRNCEFPSGCSVTQECFKYNSILSMLHLSPLSDLCYTLRVPEVLFNPQIAGLKGEGIVSLVFNSINLAPRDEPQWK